VNVRATHAGPVANRTARSSAAIAAVTVVNRLSRALGQGSGTVAGGRAGLLVDPGLLATLAAGRRVALVTGTNGKTTTTRLLAAALAGPEGDDPPVSNDTGANMPAGHVAALAGAPDARVAVLEVDEGYLGRLITEAAPDVVVLLNLSRDQLDRIAEVRMLVDRWRTSLAGLARPTPGGGGTVVVANADDPMVAFAAAAAPEVCWVGAGQVWDTATDAAGRFRILYVPVGEYHLSVDARGFATMGMNLTLSVGQAIDVPMTLSPAPVSEAVDVSAPAPVVEAGRTQVADRITPQEVDTLPLNGRNYLDLALLAPNVSRTNLRTNDRFAESSAVPGTGISVAGQRNLGNTFLVDGVSANDDAADLAGAYYGEEVIREFQVITSGGVAEFGRASAGTINILTKSGTNQARGRAYGFFRDDRLDARNPLAVQKDPLTEQQYGLSFGGPIVKDRTFWFANVEETRQNRTGIITIAPADGAAINAALDIVKGVVNAAVKFPLIP